MDTNISLPLAIALGLFFAAPPAAQHAVPDFTRTAVWNGMAAIRAGDVSSVLEDRKEAFTRNVEACLAYTMPLLPPDLREGMAEDIADEWYESDFSLHEYIIDQDPDELETIAETMEEEVLPALEDAGYEINAASFRSAAGLGYLYGSTDAIACATWLTLMQVAIEQAGTDSAALTPESRGDASRLAEVLGADKRSIEAVEPPVEDEGFSSGRITY